MGKMEPSILLLMTLIAIGQGNNNFYPNRGVRPGLGPAPPPVVINSVGFVGGPDADLTVMSMYHLFRRFLAYIVFKQGRGQHFSQRNGHYVLNEVACMGGCPRTAFCDMGICRCYKSLMALHGTCWRHHEGVIEDAANWELKKEEKLDPRTKSCSSHRSCHEIDINLICRYDTRKCTCRETMRWNAEESECQVFVPVECPRILNGTILEPDEELEEETDSEEEAELDQMTRTAIDPYDPTQQQRIMRNGQFDQRYGNRQMDYAVQKTRFDRNRHDDASRQAKDEDDDEDEEEEEPKPEQLLRLDPYFTNEFQIKEAFCHDLTILYKNFTAEDEGGKYFFAPFKSTPLIVAIFIILSIVIAGVCFYALTHTSKTEAFLSKKFKTPKRVDTPPDFRDVEDSDDDKPAPPASSSRPKNHVKVFSTPQHNPHNPFNATPEGTPRRGGPPRHR